MTKNNLLIAGATILLLVIIIGILCIHIIDVHDYSVQPQPIDYYYEGYQDGLAATWNGNTIYDHVNADIYEIGYQRGLNQYIAERVYTK